MTDIAKRYKEWKQTNDVAKRRKDYAASRLQSLSAGKLQGYYDRIKNDEFLSADDLSEYRSVLDRYISSVNYLRGNGAVKIEDDDRWDLDVKDMNDYYDSVSSYYGQFDDPDMFNTWKTYDPDKYNANVQRMNELRGQIGNIGFFENLDEEINKKISEWSGGASGWTRKELLEDALARLETENSPYLRFADPEEYQRLRDIENAPGWKRVFATGADVAKDGLYIVSKALENTVESVGRAGAGLKDLFLGATEAVNDYVVDKTGGGMVANRDIGRFVERERAKNEEYVEGLNYDWAGNTHNIYDDTLARMSLMRDIPGGEQAQEILKDTVRGVGNMAPAIVASAVTGNPFVGQAVFFANAAGGSAEEASLTGAKPFQSLGYGLAIGGLETATEKLGGSVFGEATDLASTAFGQRLIKHGGDKIVSRGFGKMAYTFGSEGAEETIMDVITPIAKATFDIGNSREEYFGENWKEGWGDVIKGLPRTFSVGGLVGMTIEGFYSGGNAISNFAKGRADGGGFKGGVTFNKIAKEMDYISTIVKSSAAVDQSASISQAQKNKYTVAANERILESINKISESARSLSAEQRAALFEKAPILDGYLNEDGTVRAEIGEAMSASSRALSERTPVAASDTFKYKQNDRSVKKGEAESGRVMSDRDISAKIERDLSTGKGQISDKAQRQKLAATISNIVRGEEFSRSEIKAIVENDRARAVLNSYLGTSFTSSAKAKDVRLAVAKMSGDYSPQGQARLFSAMFDMGENGTRGLMTLIGEARGVDLGNLAQAYNALYQVGVRGEHILKAKNPYISMLTPEQVGLAYTYGQMDGLLERGRNKNSSEVLQNDGGSGTIKENTQEDTEYERGEETGGVRLRDGSERDGGQDSGGQVSAVESGAGQDQSRREGKSRPRDREAASLTYGEEVSAKSLGIKGGLDSGRVHLIAEGSETNEMKKARARAEKRGKKVIFFAGGSLRIEQGDVVISARGYIEGDNVYVRVDHPYYTADQVMRHELGHDMIARGEVNVDEVRERIKDRYEDVDFIVERYVEAYEGSGLDADEIWEEIICDSLGDMNAFASVEVLGEMNDEFLEVLKEETRKSAKDARGPPRSAEGKASRESRAKGADYLIRHFSGKVNVNYSKIYVSNEEIAIISSSVKTGWGSLNKARTFGRVFTAKSYYLFAYNYDNSITIQNEYDMDADQEFIDILEEVLRSDKRGKGSITSVSEWVDIVRSRQRGYLVDNGDGSRDSSRSRYFDGMDGGSSKSDTERHIESSHKDDQREGKESLESPIEAKESGEINDAHFSIEFAEDIAENQRAYVERGNAAISAEELNKAIEDTAKMVETMKPYAKILPQDKVGKTLVKNGSYDMSVENTTICIRTLAYNSFVDMVSEKVGRPLTQMESFLVSQKLYEIAKEPQCLYCYVSLDRKAFNEMVIRYIDQRDAAIAAYKAAGEPKVPSSFNAEWSLFKSFLDGRKPTQNMWDRYIGWINAYKRGDRLVTLSDISTEAKRAKLVEDGGKTSAQVVDILKYAQSASWAKKQTQYVAYYDEILKLKPGVIKNLNSHYGMRWYSFSDYSGAFIVENMQQVTDAAIRGLKGLSYTKDTDYAEIFAPTGMNINISVYAMKGKDGYVIDPKQSADIQKAIKLREQYPNVGIVVVATDKAGVEWALAQEWSDVVIPFHTVRTGADVAEFYNWEIFNAEQSDVVSDQNLWDAYVNSVGKKKASKNVYPAEHQNDRDTYLEICRKRGLTPRFNSFINNLNYMKLVNETRQSEAQTKPLKPNFDLDAAERSFDKFVDKGGYYEGWYNDGIDVDGEADIVAEDVRAGKKANEVSYGRQDVDFDGLIKERKNNRSHGKASRDLDFVDFLNENAEERERSNREILANLLESEDMSPSEKGFLTKYKNKIAQIEANEAEIAEMESELKELRKAGKKDSSRAITLEGKIEARRKEIARDENMILNLESTNSIKRLLKSEKDAAYAEGMLAGQMAQGKDDAAKLRRAEEKLAEQKRQARQDVEDAHLAGQMAQGRIDAAKLRKTEEKLAEQKRKDGETLAEYKKRVAEREAEIKQKNREKLAEQREKARENLDAQAKRYQESRKKATEGRHKTKLKDDIKDVVAKLDELLRKGTKERNVKIGLQDAVASALELFDMNEEKVDRYNKDIADLDARIAAATDPVEIEALTEYRDKKIRNSERLADKLQVMKKAYEDIHNGRDGENYPSYYKAECEAIENRIAEVMEKVGDTSIGEMSLEQLEAVYDMYRMVLTTVQNANKIFKEGKLADLTDDAAAMTAELQRIKKLAEERLKAGDDIRSFVWNELTPYYAFNRIGSETLMSYYEELIRGQDVYAEDLAEAQKFAEEIREKHGYSKWKLDQVHSFKDKDGRDFRLTLRHMMSIYAYSKREQAFDHMEKGGFFFNNKETFRKKAGVLEFIASNESGYKVDARIFAQIKGALTAEQIAYVDEMQAYLTKMGEKGNEVTRVMWGIDIFKEAVYFPLKSKEDFIYQANTPAETSSLKNDGMTKETRPHASNPIVLESFDDVWANHVEKMSKYHGFVIPIDNLNKLVNYGTWMDGDSQAISTMLEARFGPGVNEYLNTFIKDLNGAKAQSGGILGSAFNLLSKFKKTSVAASLSVVVQQPTAIIRALSEIDARYFVGMPKPEILNRKWERMKKYAPIVILKDIGGFDAGSGRQITEWINADTKRGVDKAMNKADDLTMYGAALGDRIGWASIWTAVEREVKAKQKLEYGSEAFYEAVGKRFTEVIVKTQVYDSTLSRSGFMRGKDGLMKMATAFMGEPTLSVNMMADAILQAKRGKIKKAKAMRVIASVYVATVAASVIKSLIYALRDDDEDESYAEKYLQALGGEMRLNLNPLTMPLTMLPIFRDVVSIFDGWDVERTDMALVADLKNAIDALNSDTKSTWRKIEDFAGAIAAFAGVPLKNVMRTVREINNACRNIVDGIEGGVLGGAFIEGITGKEAGKRESMYNALISGDPERIEIYRDSYDSEDKYLSAVKQVLREYDPRVQRAVEGALSGSYILYNEMKDAVKAEKHFDVKTVNNAFADEKEYVLGKLNDARKARREGNSEEFDKIVQKLIERGYSEELVRKKLK